MGNRLYSQSLNLFFSLCAIIGIFTLSPVILSAQELPKIIAPKPIDAAPSINNENMPTNNDVTFTGMPTIKNIIVNGVKRIENETVLSYLSFKDGDIFNPININKSLKTLFSSGLFADVTIHRNGDNVIIKVVENPIINRIVFEKNEKIKDKILAGEVQLRPRVVYTRTKVQNDVKRILDIYRRSGRFAVNVDPKVIQLDQNRVDLVFEINEGPKTGITKISFVGNRYFSDSALRTEIFTKESRWYRFFSSADSYDPDKLTFDRELLRRFYLQNGFADFRVTSAVAELSENKEGFYITFTIDEGGRYKFGDYKVTSKIRDIDATEFLNDIKIEKNEWYNADIVDDSINSLSDAIGNKGYAFINIRPDIDRDNKNKIININFTINEGQRTYVERIDINGNIRTIDKVIRREFKLVEGDAFNSNKLNLSKKRIKDLGFFKSVEITNLPDSTPDSTIIQTDIEEKSTGELSFGAGYSTQDGVLGSIGMRELNFLGKGQKLSVKFNLGSSISDFDVSFTEPYFMDRELSAGFDLFHTVRDNQDSSSYDSRRAGAGIRLGYEISKYWRQQLRYKFSNDTVEKIKSNASIYIKAQEGEANSSVIGHTLTYDRRNSSVKPTDGYIFQFSNDFAGVGGDVNYLKTALNAVNYYQIADGYVLSTGIELGNIISTDNSDIRIFDRYFLGGSNLRGFKRAGVGPRDIKTDDALGGRNYASSSIELSFPLGLPNEFGLSGAIFTDIGVLTNVEESGANIIDTGSIRASIGFGFNWSSPFGPIRMNFTQAILKEKHDDTETFRFNFGTRF